MKTLQKGVKLPLLPADETLFRKHIQRELNEIREEVEETCAVASDIESVPEPAYAETFFLLQQIPRDIPMPDMMWLEDSGIGLEWRPGDGIVTMSLYGDAHVIFVAILGNQHEISGTCPLSDSRILPSFLATLPLLFRSQPTEQHVRELQPNLPSSVS